MVLRSGDYGQFWGCSGYPACDARVGAHPDGKPMGTPANDELRRWRRAAHAVFDRLWKGDGAEMSRAEAYAWIASASGVSHIAGADITGCLAVIQSVYARAKGWSK